METRKIVSIYKRNLAVGLTTKVSLFAVWLLGVKRLFEGKV